MEPLVPYSPVLAVRMSVLVAVAGGGNVNLEATTSIITSRINANGFFGGPEWRGYYCD
jgi:hypothetical protein